MIIEKREKIIYDKGYRVVGKNIFNPKGDKLKEPRLDTYGYPIKDFAFGSRTNKTRKIVTIYVHRIVAYQKYKDELYREGMEARHLNGDKLDYSVENIAIGTHRENILDKPMEMHIRTTRYAASHNRKFNNKQIEEIRLFHKECLSYKKTMEKFGIKAKSSLSYMLNADYVTDKIKK